MHGQGKAGMWGGSSHGMGVHLVMDGKVPIITKIFDDSGSSIILSRTGFPT